MEAGCSFLLCLVPWCLFKPRHPRNNVSFLSKRFLKARKRQNFSVLQRESRVDAGVVAVSAGRVLNLLRTHKLDLEAGQSVGDVLLPVTLQVCACVRAQAYSRTQTHTNRNGLTHTLDKQFRGQRLKVWFFVNVGRSAASTPEKANKDVNLKRKPLSPSSNVSCSFTPR